MSFFTTTVLIGVFTAGSFLLRSNHLQSNETVQFSNGRIEKVSVKNGRSYYCPYNCQIDHRHYAHDQAWKCDLDYNCFHFIISYGDQEESQHEMPDSYAAAESEDPKGTLAEQTISKP